MRPRFLVLNAIAVALALAAWRSGMFSAIPALGTLELSMLAALSGWALIGFVAGWLNKWKTVAFVAHGAPILALGMTGLGLIQAVSGLHTLTPDALATVFREMAYSIVPNILGAIYLFWFWVLAYLCDGERL